MTLLLSKSTPHLSLYLTFELRYTHMYCSLLTAILATILESYTNELLPLQEFDALN